MADAEVMATPGDMVRVKQEKGESSDSHKTQIILHLQPILQGVNEDIAETGTTVLAIETHHEEEGAEGEEVEYGYPITCGDNRAVLLFKKFVCPGINVRCVKFNDQLISPKQFVHLAGKATLKDWKRAIRLGGVMLRKMMDSGQIDFYQHDTVCTNTCRSTKFDQLTNNTRLSSGTVLQAASSSLSGWGLEIEEGPEEKLSGITDWSPEPVTPINPTTANGHFKRRGVEITDGTLDFWRGVADIGLMGDVLSSIRTELLATLSRVEVRSDKASLLEADAQVLNSLCEMFGLLDSVRRALDLRRSHTEDNQQLDHKPIHVSENRFEDQRRQNQHSPGLPNTGSSLKPASSKRLRLHQTMPSTTQTQNHTIISPFTSSQMGQSVSLAGLPVATLAQLPTDSEDFTHHSTSSGGKHFRAWALHAAPGGTLFSPTKESGTGMPAHSVSQEKEQQRVMNKDRPRIQTDSVRGTVVARRKDSYLRKEEEREGKDEEEAEVEREG